MRFWDSSAIVPLCVDEGASKAARDLLSADGSMIVWWGAPVECHSAFARLRREGALDEGGEDAARRVLAVLADAWTEILPGAEIRTICARLLLNHPLRAADSMQLAAALLWADKNPSGHPFICLDERLREAARREGFLPLPESL